MRAAVTSKLPDKPEAAYLFDVPILIHLVFVDAQILPSAVESYKPRHWKRLQAKPGLTGWWQIHGRGVAEFNEGVEQDIWYIEHQSFWLDLFIILKTPQVVLAGDGAK